VDITEFVRARLDEDEAAAKAWQSPPWREDATNWRVVGQREPRYDNGRSETLTVIDVSGRAVDFAEAIQVRWDSNGERAEHIARHDPARVLREVAAKRAIVAQHVAIPMRGIEASSCRECRSTWPCSTVRHFAAVWSDHPDYRAEWKSEP
jgi:hypothetical protein